MGKLAIDLLVDRLANDQAEKEELYEFFLGGKAEYTPHNEEKFYEWVCKITEAPEAVWREYGPKIALDASYMCMRKILSFLRGEYAAAHERVVTRYMLGEISRNKRDEIAGCAYVGNVVYAWEAEVFEKVMQRIFDVEFGIKTNDAFGTALELGANIDVVLCGDKKYVVLYVPSKIWHRP